MSSILHVVLMFEMQKTYAATDAWIGLKLWHIMRKMDRYDEEAAPLVSDIEFQIPIPPIFTKPTHESFELLPRLRAKHRDVIHSYMILKKGGLISFQNKTSFYVV